MQVQENSGSKNLQEKLTWCGETVTVVQGIKNRGAATACSTRRRDRVGDQKYSEHTGNHSKQTLLSCFMSNSSSEGCQGVQYKAYSQPSNQCCILDLSDTNKTANKRSLLTNCRRGCMNRPPTQPGFFVSHNTGQQSRRVSGRINSSDRSTSPGFCPASSTSV